MPYLGRSIRNVTLELSLRPFLEPGEDAIRKILRRMFRQWRPLAQHADSASVMMWASDGSELLSFSGNLDDRFEWSHTVGTANPHVDAADPRDPENKSIHRHPYLFVDHPPEHTYRWYRRFLELVREVGSQELGIPITLGATFDPGPEFAKSVFKYERHPEICLGGTMGHASFVTCYSTLHGDKERYAGYPEGIPEGTPFGAFLGRQSRHFLSAMGFDWLWLSNGFGFGMETWGMYGAVFNGKTFDTGAAKNVKEKSLGFFEAFRKECPDVPLRTRGTNQTTGRDLSCDGVPLREIYRGGFNLEPPVNSPWAAINGDFGLELSGWMSHVAEIPGKTWPWRFYAHDNWFVTSPWYDRYGREAHDIHLPLAISRVEGDGSVSVPTDINLLSVDGTYGEMPDQVPNEIIPRILENLGTSPDAPGLVTWVYPFDEYHDMALDPRRIDEVFFGDWFVRSSINQGLPLNTVVSTGNFVKALGAAPGRFKGTILFAPTAVGPATAASLVAHAQGGGNLFLYGPTRDADPALCALLGLRQGKPLEGELELELRLETDPIEDGKHPDRILHTGLSSAGGVTELASDGLAEADILARIRSGSAMRVYAVSRRLPGGGTVTWVRGTNSFALPDSKTAHLPAMLDPEKYFHPEILPRLLLSAFGCGLRVKKRRGGQRNPILAISRHRNAFFFAGHSPDTTVDQQLRLPQGAPIFFGGDTWLTGGHSTWRMPKAWRQECRVFVEQTIDGKVSCERVASIMHGISHRYRMRGLQDATVRFCPVPGTEARVTFLRDPEAEPHYHVGDFRLPKLEHGPAGAVLTVEGISGDLLISW